MDSYITFGSFVAGKRLEKDMSLRTLATKMGFSAAFWCDIEKDRKNPPTLEKLDMLSRILCLSDEEKKEMLDLAGKSRDTIAPDIPAYFLDNEEYVPLLRKVRDYGAEKEDWEKFVEDLRQKTGKGGGGDV